MKQEAPPLISASMIVRDEEANLPSCLASLAGLVDEVVLYDTGSTDRTIAVAKDLAGRFGLDLNAVEGYWDDDFSRARNASLALAKGEWILVVDADETVECENPEALREQLSAVLVAQPGSKGDVDGLQVSVDNVRDSGLGSLSTNISLRMFRRTRCHYVGNLHELVVTTLGKEARAAYMPSARIRHRGYALVGADNTSKAQRNLRIAETDDAELEGGRPPCTGSGHSRVNAGMAHLQSGRFAEAVDILEHASRTPGLPPTEVRRALIGVVNADLALQQFDHAASVVKRLRHQCNLPALPDFLEARVCFTEGMESPDSDTRRTRLERCTDLIGSMRYREIDDDGREFGREVLSGLMARSLVELGEYKQAATVMLSVLKERGVLEVEVAFLVACLDLADVPLCAFADALAPWQAEEIVRQALELHPSARRRLLGALSQRWPDDAWISAAYVPPATGWRTTRIVGT